MKPKFLIIIFLSCLVLFSNQALAGTATLSWDVNRDPDLAGYKIYYGTSPRTNDCPPGNYSDKIDVGKTANLEKPSYKIENLADGKTYYFSITSYDVYGNESCFSAEISKTLPRARISLFLPFSFLKEIFDPLILFFDIFFKKF